MNPLQGHSSTNTLSNYSSSEPTSPTTNSPKSAFKENFPLKNLKKLNTEIEEIKKTYKPFATPKGSKKNIPYNLKNRQDALIASLSPKLAELEAEKAKINKVARTSFATTKKIILIPTHKEYLAAGLDLWRSEQDIESYKKEVWGEIKEFLKTNPNYSVKDAARALYQPD